MNAEGKLENKEIQKLNSLDYKQNCIIGGNQNYLYPYLKEAMDKAIRIDIIVSFLMESGVRLLEKDFISIANRDIPIRILTGNYLNITEPSALYLLKSILGDKADIRLYADKSRSFHPKAYIFEYKDGGDIFIGSSNISKSAMTSGIEWNYRITKNGHDTDFSVYKDTFENLFYNESIILNDNELENYSKNWRRPKLYRQIENINNSEDKEIAKVTEIFKPRGAQIEALYELNKQREDGIDKSLVVAATGIGKTYLAAFDSMKFEKILFVAHREEILKQAERTFKSIRPDSKTGFFMNNIRNLDCDIIFASIQTLGKSTYLNDEYFSMDYFDYIIIDEFHHAVANNYRNIIEYFKPKFMLGLTATPDRLDNKDVYMLCDYNIAYEAPLNVAVNKGWLVPFRYYGIYDESVNYENIEFHNGKYNEKQLEEALSINKRAELILRHYKKYISKRALGFCSSKIHAEFMAKYFDENGIKSCSVYSGEQGTYCLDRNEALSKFRDGEVNVIFSVDMFNEGLDVKAVDMVMFLRPTESPTVFLQQLGRGLRKDGDKKYLNVLDFIGNYKKANLIPFLLKGSSNVSRNRSINGIIPREEDFPEDCIVDFDFRLIDIFKKMAQSRIKLNDLIAEEYFRIKEELNKRPTRVELFTYMDDDIYYNMKRNANLNLFNNYLGFLKKNNELIAEEKELINTVAEEFINMIETTSMNKTYKMPVLLAFYNNGNIKLKINDDDIYKSFLYFYSSGSNGIDLVRDKSTSNYKSWGKKEYVSLAKRNPIKFLLKTHSKYFYSEEDFFCLNIQLEGFISNQSFIDNFKDAIELRTKEFYKNRLLEKYKKDRLTINYALRDEKINIQAMTIGGIPNSFNRNYDHQILICKTSPIPDNRKLFVLDSKKSNSSYKYSEIGKEYAENVMQSYDMKYVAFVDSQIKVRVTKELFEKLYIEGFFSIWDPDEPFKYFRGNKEGYLVLFRVYEIKDYVPEELLQKGRKGANYYFKLTEEFETEIGLPVINDKDYNIMKEDIIKTLSQNNWLLNI